jgi:hypothetical protein
VADQFHVDQLAQLIKAAMRYQPAGQLVQDVAIARVCVLVQFSELSALGQPAGKP